MSKSLLFVACAALLTACQSPSSSDHKDLEIMGTWHIEKVQDKGVIDYSPAQLTFGEDGKLSGNNSCNQFIGQYQLDGNQLTLTPAGSTMKACVEALMDQEQRVMQALTTVTQASISKGKLRLKDADNKTQLILSQQ
ncbi:META domain-containing protein [Shewanella sp. AS1]|uniref:META domain-containing protein n=1 Tax=Shewanella sp. AS1 TaxID=2907626 RepID=UPI001F1A2B04|nr:META domain-containing protein [Shewanella sp. AS1]MCE9677740.1 META domain-containing protein [Shewanella sp. AS1]